MSPSNISLVSDLGHIHTLDTCLGSPKSNPTQSDSPFGTAITFLGRYGEPTSVERTASG